MRPLAKAGLVAGGYAAALGAAWLVVSIYVAATGGPDREQYAAMYGCGDALLFLAVFGVAAVPATAAALIVVRSRPGFWRVLSVASLAVTATAVAALVGHMASRAFEASAPLPSWSALATLRILVAPLFAIFFLVSGVISPARRARIFLLAAMTIETAVFLAVALTWLPAYRH